MHDQVLILDFGSQYTQLIARRIREQGVYCEIHPCTRMAPPQGPPVPALRGIILSGGPSSLSDADAPPFDPAWLDQGVPVLGVCYGMYLVAHHNGGEVRGGGDHREYGAADLEKLGDDPLFDQVPLRSPTWMSHGDSVTGVPAGFTTIARTSSCPVAAISNPAKRQWGIQFHPEVTHSRDGVQVLRNFIFGICEARADWSMGGFVDEQVARIREQVGEDGEVICALSGGVDSSVAAAILHRAIGSRLHCIFVDNGLLRKGERESVRAEFADFDLTVVDATERFLTALDGVTDPERKRKIIGEQFIRVFEQESHRFERASWLAQGTLYPDVIESVSFKGPSATIKSHHNVGGLPKDMKLKLIEPLRELFKDEVRVLGKALGLSDARVWRQPFPGPGLAVRCLGTLTQVRLDVLREADAIVDEEIRAAGLYRDIWQSFAVLLPVRSVGVMGDSRTYEEVCAIRAVNSTDGMTASVAPIPLELLTKMASRITNSVRGINRVVYDLSSKPPGTIEWE